MSDSSKPPPDSLNPNIAGRENELFALAGAVRRLSRLTIMNNADLETTALLAAEANSLADKLEQHIQKEDFSPHRHPEGGDPNRAPSDPRSLFHLDGFAGPYNPIAVPLKLEWEPPLAIGKANFNELYVGPPGCVHGGFIAAYFDQVFTLANTMSGVGGPTAKLTINYRKPTPLHRDLRFEAEVDYVAGSRIHTKGALYNIVDGEKILTVDAEGLFIKLSREKILKMAKGE